MDRILVIGNCGAGKTYFSEQLAQKLNLPLIHLDHLFWLPNWQQRPRAEFDKILLNALQKERWIIDGNYMRTLPTRIKYTSTVVYLNFNRWLCAYRVIKRFLKGQQQAQGCTQKISLSFLWKILFSHPLHQKKSIENLKTQYLQLIWIELITPTDAANFLQSLETNQ